MNNNNRTGVTYGIIIGLIYVLILFYRWSSANSLIKFGIISIAGYLIILGLMIFEASQIRKMNGGFIELKSLFKTLFISVLIFEFLYAFYNFIHLRFIDPNVVERMKQGIIEMFDNLGDRVSDKDKEGTLEKMNDLDKATELPQMIKSYFTSVAISGVFALIISAIFKKKKPVFEEIN